MNAQDLKNLAEAYKQLSTKKDDSYLETDMKKRKENNEKAVKDMKKMGSMKNPAFEETQVTEKLDPVGQEDDDVNNDGKKNTSTDKYLMKRRAAIGKAMGKKKMSEGVRDMDPEKGTAERKARLEKKRGMKMDDHPQYKKEEAEVEEGFKGKHGQSDKEYADSRSPGGKMVSGDSKMSGAEYTHGRRVKAANPGMQPDVGGKTKPKSQGKMDQGTRADLKYRKANLAKKEELELTGKFTAEEIEKILEIMGE